MLYYTKRAKHFFVYYNLYAFKQTKVRQRILSAQKQAFCVFILLSFFRESNSCRDVQILKLLSSSHI